ncbi:MAG: hypothetical protein U0736_26560 [Gemmataceae bacterium]
MAGPEDVSRADSWQAAETLLARERFDTLVADLRDPAVLAAVRTARQANRILDRVADGIAVVDFDLARALGQPGVHRLVGGAAAGRPFYDALAPPGRASARSSRRWPAARLRRR